MGPCWCYPIWLAVLQAIGAVIVYAWLGQFVGYRRPKGALEASSTVLARAAAAAAAAPANVNGPTNTAAASNRSSPVSAVASDKSSTGVNVSDAHEVHLVSAARLSALLGVNHLALPKLPALYKLRRPAIAPFENATPRLTQYERFKIAVMSVTMMPIRLLSMVTFLPAIVMVMWAASIGYKKEKDQPLPRWRQHLMWPAKLLTKVWYFVLGYYYIPTKGKPAPPNVAPLVVPNHLSFPDALYMVGTYRFSAVSRRENADFPVIGTGLRVMQCLLVDRTDKNSRNSVMTGIQERADPTKGWPSLLVFPEGTTSNGRAVICFKPGAFTPGQPVQPVAIRFPFKHFDATWTSESPDMGPQTLRLMCQFVNKMSIEFLPVYYPSKAEKADANLFAHNVQQVIADKLGVPATDHCFSDVLLGELAYQHGYTSASIDFEYTHLYALAPVSVDTLKRYLEQFIALDAKEEAAIDLAHFQYLFPSGASVQVKRLFLMLDQLDEGKLKFREFVLGLTTLHERSIGKRAAALDLAYHLMRSSQEGMTVQDVTLFVRNSGSSAPAAQITAWFDAADTDHDGFINAAQFAALADSAVPNVAVSRGIMGSF